jgi:hypothetical protein
MTAQGSALGLIGPRTICPERAKPTNDKGLVMPFQDAAHGRHITQGVALGYPVSGFQPAHLKSQTHFNHYKRRETTECVRSSALDSPAVHSPAFLSEE